MLMLPFTVGLRVDLGGVAVHLACEGVQYPDITVAGVFKQVADVLSVGKTDPDRELREVCRIRARGEMVDPVDVGKRGGSQTSASTSSNR